MGAGLHGRAVFANFTGHSGNPVFNYQAGTEPAQGMRSPWQHAGGTGRRERNAALSRTLVRHGSGNENGRHVDLIPLLSMHETRGCQLSKRSRRQEPHFLRSPPPPFDSWKYILGVGARWTVHCLRVPGWCSADEMSLPASSELLSLEKMGRHRCTYSNGSPYATNKPIDIKARRRW
ncbi:hypothetical protein COCON_G00165680 [Conger conger]|uniref:Uncharacterized protein n=1 Tax=Conger conger TaxID=82655 RepID=A0A9Q1D6Y9_CONCO|nr:hypothetical protein COCON_G00165680 [Conger conger]